MTNAVMSKDDFETGEHLLNPYIEMGRDKEPAPDDMLHINVSTFEKCLSHLTPAFTDNGPQIPEVPFCSVYGVVGRTVAGHGHASLNITESPLSRTLMGHLPASVLKDNLPEVYEALRFNGE